MKVKAKVFGVEKLVKAMGSNEKEVDFQGGNVNQFFSALLGTYGFRWEDFPLLKDWQENLSVTILHNGEILNKEDYGRKNLKDGDLVSFLLHTGCC